MLSLPLTLTRNSQLFGALNLGEWQRFYLFYFSFELAIKKLSLVAKKSDWDRELSFATRCYDIQYKPYETRQKQGAAIFDSDEIFALNFISERKKTISFTAKSFKVRK